MIVFMRERPDLQAAVIAVPNDAVYELEQLGLAFSVRGPALQAAVTIGTDAATLVTLVQAPETIGAFARWVAGRCGRSSDSVELIARRQGKLVRIAVTGDVEPRAIAEFIERAITDMDDQRS
jgi:hypothetical protein